MPKNENTPRKGDIVLVTQPERGADVEHVAIVTRMYDYTKVNLKVLPDMQGIYDLASVFKKNKTPGGSGKQPEWRWPS